MKSIILQILLALSISFVNGACENSWAAYKDELCIKSFTLLQSYDEAKQLCSSQGDYTSEASLVIVKKSELQSFLTSYNNGTFDNIWLGGRNNNNTGQFQWEDGDALTYTNWQEGYPRNIDNADSCIELRPLGGKHSRNGQGKWANVPCQKRNLALCQKSLSWSLADAVAEIIKIRKQLDYVNSKIVPVGSIYIEYFNQLSPPSLWPSLTWLDITHRYAGLFFRAHGGDSESWGTTQSECAPRITSVEARSSLASNYPNNITIPASGHSAYAFAGLSYDNGVRGEDAIRFYTTNCETRPRNKAIRIWKRTN